MSLLFVQCKQTKGQKLYFLLKTLLYMYSFFNVTYAKSKNSQLSYSGDYISVNT